MLKPIAIAALLLTPPGTPSGGFRWQRIITPPAGQPLAPACVVLDADTFANAAPALRDLRLFQDGSELPYVIQESFDERALTSGVTTADDRSLYETSVIGNFQPTRPGIIAGVAQGLSQDEALEAQSHGGLGYYARFFLPAYVPVERIRVEPAPDRPEQIGILGGIDGDSGAGSAELVDGVITPEHPVFPITLGANLQHEAIVTVGVRGSDQPMRRVVGEMRRRSLCYEPRSASPLTLYLGGGEGMAAKAYDLAGNFSTAVERPFATMGPLIPNPDQQHRRGVLSGRRWSPFLLMVVAAITLFSAAAALQRHRRLVHQHAR